MDRHKSVPLWMVASTFSAVASLWVTLSSSVLPRYDIIAIPDRVLS